ncbi:ankyrin repeat domain-containing protein SOWAHB [Lepisosteus oculatus]|uniref:ankyrin repeat domain-containing protein SOWAHB n=1 Tax=Lepisosteus oculatus TaxID=7918 RepID=UPI0037138FAA
MATEFSQASVLDFLCRRGGKVKNADLLRHFHAFLRDPEKQAQNRDLFKRFVNSVAVVKNEGGVSSVALKRKYRDLIPDFSSAVSSSGETEDSGLGETFTNRRDLNRKPEKAFPAAQNGLIATQATAHSTSHLSSPGDLQASSSIWCKPSANSGEEEQISLRPLHYALPPEAPIRPSAKTSALCSQSGLSASHGNLLQPTYACAEDAESPQRLPGDEWGSIDGLNSKGLARTRQSKVLDMLQRAERKVDDWHGLMGNFPSQDTWAPPLGGESGPLVPLRAGNRKEKDRLRSRKCRSMGADLDWSFSGEETSGKHSRLLLLSSSLGLGPALAPRARAQSYREISQGDASRARPVAAQEGAYRYRSTPVPLDSREHDWLVKAAAGTWTEIYSLFREQPSLLGKKDFVSGYTVLHWIAKHGDHQVLNTLWYGVSKAGLELDVNVKSSCGYTPLHIAAIHGHKKLIRVLVHKFKANPSLRDTGGKRPWHYLARTGPADLLQLLGAPQNQYLPSTAQQFVPDRPALPTAAVKRHSSFAVFHKKFSKLQAAPTISESAV